MSPLLRSLVTLAALFAAASAWSDEKCDTLDRGDEQTDTYVDYKPMHIPQWPLTTVEFPDYCPYPMHRVGMHYELCAASDCPTPKINPPPPGQFDPIITDCSGCPSGCELKNCREYCGY